MAKSFQRKRNPNIVLPPSRPGSAPWQTSYGLYIAGSEAIDDMKVVIRAMEDKLGVGALRMKVGAELREKFDRQRYLTNQAIWAGDLEELRTQTKRMISAYRALDKAAEAAGESRKPVEQWEAVLDFGAVLVVVKHPDDVVKVAADGRKKVVWSLDEVAALVDQQTATMYAKLAFPGATVIKTDSQIDDPLNNLKTSDTDLDQDISDIAVVDDCPF